MARKSEGQRQSALTSIRLAMRSWRTASVVLLSFSSGLPLGLVWIAIPDWLRKADVDIRVVGLITLSQAPWTFKFLWSPFMDRFVPPWLGRRRGWMAISQVLLFGLTLWLAGVGQHPETIWVIGALALAIAFASATQDIALDAYAVDVLRREEQGIAAGARIAVYRAGMYVAGALMITLAGKYSWFAVCTGLACLYLPMLFITLKAPEPEEKLKPPATLKEAVWLPFLGFLRRHRALEILAFVILYKLGDNLAGTLLRPFLIDMGYSDFDRGVALGTVGLASTLTGTFIGGLLTNVMGLGHSLWVFGFVQILSNIGYVLVASYPPSPPLMYSAMGFENFTQGLGMGAFSVLLLRMTQKRFSATQYALFSSLFGISRVLAGPVSGIVVYAAGWIPFFWGTMVAGIPGLIMLARFVRPGVREPEFEVRQPLAQKPLSHAQIGIRAILSGVFAFIFAAFFLAIMAAIKTMRGNPPGAFDPMRELRLILIPPDLDHWITLGGVLIFGLIFGMFAAAILVARSGAGLDLHEREPV